MRSKIDVSIAAVMVMALLNTCSAFASEVRVLLPPPAKGLIQEAARLFARDHPDTQIRIDEAASLALLDKARSGSSFDMVVKTAPLMKTIQDEGLAKDAEKFAEGYSVIAFRKGASAPRAENPADVKALVLRASKVSLSDPALGGASSNFFMSIAKDQGVEAEVRRKAVYTKGGQGAAPVDRGEAEYGVAQMSELLELENVDAVPLIPADSKSRVPYFIALSVKSTAIAEARNFLQFLQSNDVTQLKEAQGLR